MEEKYKIPDYVINIYKKLFDTELYPNIVKTKNITQEGIENVINKGNLIWSKSCYINKYIFIEGVTTWSKNKVAIYFEKLENELTYKIIILTDDLSNIDILLVGLNKFFTIDIV